MDRQEFESLFTNPEAMKKFAEQAKLLEKESPSGAKMSPDPARPIKVKDIPQEPDSRKKHFFETSPLLPNIGLLPPELRNENPEKALAKILQKCKKSPSDANQFLLENAINRLTTRGELNAETEELVNKAISELTSEPNTKGKKKITKDSIWTRVYQHADFAGRSLFLNNRTIGPYRRVIAGLLKNYGMHDNISSLYVRASPSEKAGVVILFQKDYCKGRFTSFPTTPDIPTRPAFYHYVGNYMNDRTSSILFVRRYENELEPIPLDATYGISDQMANYLTTLPHFSFKKGLITYSVSISGRGNPIVTWDMWPDFDRRNFVYLRVPIHLNISYWPDYDAELRFWIYLYIDDEGMLQGDVAYYDAWVESGLFHGLIKSKIIENMPEAVEKIETEFLDYLPLINLSNWALFERLYYLPGNSLHSDQYVLSGHTNDDVTLVLVKK